MDNSNIFTVEQAKILVVDDNPSNLEVLYRILEKQRHTVRCVSNGAEALEIAQSGWAELILLDIRMPEMSGYEICEQLKVNSKTQNIPVIFLSVLDDVLDKVKAFQVGAVDYITKPFEFQEVLVRVDNQLLIHRTQNTVRLLNEQLEAKIKKRTVEYEIVNEQLTTEIEQRQQAQDKLLRLALNDPTTGLPNRNALLGQLKQSLIKYQKIADEQFAVLLISCSLVVSERGQVGFPEIKCYLDHLALNQLFIAISSRLQNCLPTSVIPSRCEGNEFALILEPIKEGRQEIMQWVKTIEKQFNKPFDITYLTIDKQEKKQELTMASNIGIVIVESDLYSTAYDILHDTEIAVCQAQVNKESNYHFFDKKNFDIEQLSGMFVNDNSANLALALKQLKAHFKEALRREKINLYYQPIFDLEKAQNPELVGLEVISDRHSYQKLVSLTHFFQDIEKSKLDVYISNLTLDYACYYIKRLQLQHETQQYLFLTMQFDEQYLLQPQLVYKLEQILTKIKLSPKCLQMNIIGDGSSLANKKVLSVMKKLNKLGVKLNLEYTNICERAFSKITKVSFNSFNIPSSMTARISEPDSQQNSQIAIAKIVYLAHQNKITVTAKGIDNQEQLIYLKSIGCDRGQGNLLSQPLDMESLDTFLVWRI